MLLLIIIQFMLFGCYINKILLYPDIIIISSQYYTLIIPVISTLQNVINIIIEMSLQYFFNVQLHHTLITISALNSVCNQLYMAMFVTLFLPRIKIVSLYSLRLLLIRTISLYEMLISIILIPIIIRKILLVLIFNIPIYDYIQYTYY